MLSSRHVPFPHPGARPSAPCGRSGRALLRLSLPSGRACPSCGLPPLSASPPLCGRSGWVLLRLSLPSGRAYPSGGLPPPSASPPLSRGTTRPPQPPPRRYHWLPKHRPHPLPQLASRYWDSLPTLRATVPRTSSPAPAYRAPSRALAYASLSFAPSSQPATLPPPLPARAYRGLPPVATRLDHSLPPLAHRALHSHSALRRQSSPLHLCLRRGPLRGSFFLPTAGMAGGWS